MSDFFPEFPKYAEKITVRHLLNHTSGLRDYLALARLKGVDDENGYTDKDIMSSLINQRDLNFQPGSEYTYCNSGYWLLSQIVKEVTGQSMAKYAQQKIFQPLGMKNTHFHDDHTAIVPNRAVGYRPTDDGYAISMTTLDDIGAGGIYTTIEDIKIWDDAFFSSKTLDSAFWEEMTLQGKLNDGSSIHYASGLIIGEYKGLRFIRHGGAFVGYRTELLRFPDQHLSIAIFANRSDAKPSVMAIEIANQLLAYQFVEIEKPEANKIIEEQPINKNKFIGEYELKPGIIFSVNIEEDSVQVTQKWNSVTYNLIWLSGNTYRHPQGENFTFRFKDLKSGFTQSVDVNQGGRITECKRYVPFDPNSIHSEDYEGTYYSKELEVNYKITQKEGDLYLSVNNLAPEILIPENTDQFLGTNSLTFIRENGIVVGFTLDAGRVKNLKFQKL